METADIQRLLSSRAFFYRLFAEILYKKPCADFLQLIAADGCITAILQEDMLDENEKKFFLELESIKRYKSHDWTQLNLEYIHLFVDPEHVRVCPWESVYRSREHVIFDEHTLAVQNFYQQWGMTAPDRAAGPADHIGIECSFIAYLSEIAADCLEKTDLCENLSAQHGFLRDHICQYIDKFCQSLAKESVHPFYRNLAYFLRSYVTTDLAVLAEIIKLENCKEDKRNEF